MRLWVLSEEAMESGRASFCVSLNASRLVPASQASPFHSGYEVGHIPGWQDPHTRSRIVATDATGRDLYSHVSREHGHR